MKNLFSKKNVLSTCLFILAILVLALGVFKYFKEVKSLKTYHFTAEDIAGYTPENSDEPTCINGSIDESYAFGVYSIVPNLYLEEGYYKYTVEYTCDGAAGAKLSLESPIQNYKAFEASEIAIYEGENTGTAKYWQNQNLYMTLKVYYNSVGTINITGYTIEQSDLYATRELFCYVCFAVFVLILGLMAKYYSVHELKQSTKFVFASLFATILFVSLPALVPWTYIGHDLVFHLARIQGIADGISNGQIPVLINPLPYNGYGYADPIMYGNVFLYIPALILLCGVKLTTAYNIYVVLVNVLTVFLCYYSIKGMTKDKVIAIVATVLYTLSPYRITDIYVRNAVGEYTAMAFLPLIVYGMYRIYTDDLKDKKKSFDFLPLAIGISGVIQSHILSVEMVAAFVLLSCVVLIKYTIKPRRLLKLLCALGSVIVLNLGFLVPFADFYLNQDMAITANESNNLIQYTGAFLLQVLAIIPQGGHRKSNSEIGVSGDMCMAVGAGIVLGVILCGAIIAAKTDSEDENKNNYLKGIKIAGIVSVIFAVLSIFMSTAHFPWDYIASVVSFAAPFIGALQFVWRWLTIATVMGTVASACGLIILKRIKDKTAFGIAAAVMLALQIIAAGTVMNSFTETQGSVIYGDIYDTGISTAFMTGYGEYTPTNPSWDDIAYVNYPRAEEGLLVTGYGKKGTNIGIEVTNYTDEDKMITLPILWYKGYSATDTTGVISRANLIRNTSSEVNLIVPAGYSGTATVWFAGTWYWTVAEIINLVAVLAVIFLGIFRKIRKKSEM